MSEDLSQRLKNERIKLEKRIEEINQHLAKIDELKERTRELRTLESYSSEEKIKAFDELFKLAQSIVDGAIEQRRDKDDRVYCYDSILALLGDLNIIQQIMEEGEKEK